MRGVEGFEIAKIVPSVSVCRDGKILACAYHSLILCLGRHCLHEGHRVNLDPKPL